MNLNDQEKPQVSVPPFIDLTHDFGFKIVMANPDNPELMMRLLNELIPEREIVSITFLNPEVQPPTEEYHRNNYDIQCTDKAGNRFIVEMQKEPYEYFRDRLMVYSGDPLRHLLKKGEDYGNVRTLYVVCILGGHLLVRDEDKSFRHSLLRYAHVTMADSQKVLSNKLNFIFLQLPEAKEPTSESSFIERWAYYVSTMGEVETKPAGLAPYFDLLFEASDRRNIEEDKLSIYDKMVRDEIQIKAERDYAIKEALDDYSIRKEAEKQYAIKEALEDLSIRKEAEKQYAIKEALEDLSIRKETEKQYAIKEALEGQREELEREMLVAVDAAQSQALEQGMAEGVEQTKLKTARNLKAEGIPADVIAKCTGLTLEQVAGL